MALCSLIRTPARALAAALLITTAPTLTMASVGGVAPKVEVIEGSYAASVRNKTTTGSSVYSASARNGSASVPVTYSTTGRSAAPKEPATSPPTSPTSKAPTPGAESAIDLAKATPAPAAYSATTVGKATPATEASPTTAPLGASARRGSVESGSAIESNLRLKLLEEALTTKLPEGSAPNEVWVSVDLVERKIVVYRGHKPIQKIDHLAFGASGFERLRMQGSRQTPIGEFRVDRINRASKFHRFFGIDYPNKPVADKALEEGLISAREHRHIYNYIDRHGIAPSDTALGGLIGIHGVGLGDPEIHEMFDWTQGCVAITNDEIMDLSRHLEIGTRVVIRG